MASIFDGVDTTDPCATWPLLEKARLELLAGERVSRVRYGEDDVTLSSANIGDLEREIARLRDACAAKTSGRRARRAFRAGFR